MVSASMGVCSVMGEKSPLPQHHCDHFCPSISSGLRQPLGCFPILYSFSGAQEKQDGLSGLCVCEVEGQL